MNKIVVIMLSSVIALSSFTTVMAKEEIIFEPISAGNFSILQLNEDNIFLINTGNYTSADQVLSYLSNFNHKNIKGILITNNIPENCGNLTKILDAYEVDNLYMPLVNQEQCEVPQAYENKVFKLEGHDQIAISSNYYIEYVYNEHEEAGNVSISNGEFICFWYEGAISYDKWSKKVQVMFLPDNQPGKRLTEEDLMKLDPEVAIINQRDQTDSLVELFQKQWVDIYALRKGVSAHVSIFKDDYELFLKRE
ncbi:hypothetical protein E3U55_04025 [Filobacillus milosensis]|uniref:MBL fold metallo-hydrolase n=1 Tax=Filobacillus milosensis TaxID=94137 RepID=A0A4Y8IUX7_9BACI|nr:hypothetical protein [Filobacillus milosensis]TFB23989.1 hypothetical protein E3U55_04025 [Filobacillus milosensis]